MNNNIMKKISFYLLIFILISCNSKEVIKNDLELEILNDTLIAYPFNKFKDTINVINYSIKNNSNHIYYFNQGVGSNSLSNKIYKNGIFITIHETTSNKEVSYSDKLPFEHNNRSFCDSCCNFIQSIRLVKDVERLKETIKGGIILLKIKDIIFLYTQMKNYFLNNM